MKEFLKGNYKLDVEIKETEDAEASRLETEFERKALSRLGGSICFVSKKNFVWNGEAQPEASRADTEAGRAATSQGGETSGTGTPDRRDA
jgi:hypothetical protein